MRRRFFVALFSVLALSSIVGCAGPTWVVLVQTAPDPFVGQRRFAVLPTDYSGLRIGEEPEPVYLARKDPGQRASFLEDKAAMNDRFLAILREKGAANGIEFVPATGPGTAQFVLKPSVRFIEPGFYAGVAGASSHVNMNLKILAPDGRVLDEIEMAHGTSPSSGVGIMGFDIPANPSSGGRLRKDGEALGELTAVYVSTRVLGR